MNPLFSPHSADLIQGVGETLRGTLNSTIDHRFPRGNAEKAAAADAKNQAVLARGQNEMAGIPSQDKDGLSTQNAAADPIPASGGVYPLSGPRGSLDSESRIRGKARDGSHSAVFGLTPDGHRHNDTSPSPTPPQQASNTNLRTQGLGSVSGLDSSSSTNQKAAGGGSLYVPPRGTAVRGSSDYAPESISGNVERIPSQRQGPEPGTNRYAATSGEDYSSQSETSGVKKHGTLSKLFKRKPVANPDTSSGDEKKKYY